LRVIVDTYILISGLLSRKGAPAKIVDALLEGRILPVMSKETFAELESVLAKPRLEVYFKGARVLPEVFLENIKAVAEFVHPHPTETSIRDIKDIPFIELAATIPQPEYLITGDKDFEQKRYHGVSVVSASFFVEEILALSKE
jgi:putative PIN family toxin of toxin-antitoxin system